MQFEEYLSRAEYIKKALDNQQQEVAPPPANGASATGQKAKPSGGGGGGGDVSYVWLVLLQYPTFL